MNREMVAIRDHIDQVSGCDDFLAQRWKAMNLRNPRASNGRTTLLRDFLDAFSALLMEIENAYVNDGKPAPDGPLGSSMAAKSSEGRATTSS